MFKTILVLAQLFLFIQFINAQNEIGVWEVRNGQLTIGDSDNKELGEKYWNTLYSILPTDLIDRYVISFRLFTDGKDEDMGGMNQIDETVDFWEIDLDTADMNIFSNDSVEILNYTHTLIHEFGHLLTLNPKQIKLTDDKFQDDDRGYLTSEGYALKDSYLGRFVYQFWNSNLLFEWDEIEKIKNESRKIDFLYDFYLSYKDEFVTDYAAESPEEDIAESWTFFVLSDKPELSTVKYQKILFFYQFPELVQYREKIRSNVEFIPISYIEQYINTSH